MDENEQAPEQSVLEEVEHGAEAVVDWVEHEAALLMFEANAGLASIKARFADGAIGFLHRDGTRS